MRISPETFNTSRQAEYTGASLMNIATQEEIKIEGIPDNAVITEASFSPSSNKVALFVEEANGVYLYNCTPEQPVAQKVSTRKINATSGAEILWISDNEFITLMVPENREGTGETHSPIRSHHSRKYWKGDARSYLSRLAENPYDEQLFDYYFTSQLVRIKRALCTRSENQQSTAVRFHYPRINLCYLSRQFIVRIPIKYRYITSHKSSRS